MTWGAVAGAAITAGTGYMSAKKNAKKGSSSVALPPWLEGASEDAINRATRIADRPYQAFTGQRVAGLSSNEQQAGRLASAFGSRLNNRLQTGFRSEDLAQFENPYIDRVLNARKRAIGEEFGRQSASLASRQSAMNAFRSGRSDLARSRLDEARMRALDDAEAETRAGAFDSAMNSFFQNESVTQGAFDRAQQGLQTTGLADRSVRQAQMDFDYGQFLERRDWDVNNLRPLLDAISAAQGGSTTTHSGEKKDYWGAAAGLLGTAVTTYLGQPKDTGYDIGPAPEVKSTDIPYDQNAWRGTGAMDESGAFGAIK